MPDFLPPVVAELLLNSSEFSKGLAKADAEMSGFARGAAGAGKLIAEGLAVAGAAAVVVGVASIKMASDFQASMTRVRTQAHDTTDNLKTMGNAVLALAPQVGEGPTALADALYHITSVGYRGADAMAILKLGAEGARISGANLDDTVYSLTSTMKTFGDTGVAGATKDMAMLNSLVGAGDMRFQDLNAAIQTGILSTGQTFGVSMQSMGAALAYLTDRGEKADVASTRLSMGIALMAAPTSKAADILKSIGVSTNDIATGSAAMTQALAKSGVTQTQLAQDLRKPDGIYVALKDLKDAMDKGGIAAQDQGTIISKVFGGARTGKAIMALYENLDGVQQKFGMIGQGVSRFGQDWADTQKTFTQQLHDFTAGIDAAGIKIGLFLIPQVLKLGKAIGDAWHSVNSGAGGSLLQNLGAGFQAPSMTNFNAGIDGAFEHAGVAIRQFLDSAQKLGTQLGQALLPALRDVWSFITGSLAPSLANLWQALQGPLGAALAVVVGSIRLFAAALKDVVGPALVAVTGFLKEHKAAVEAVALAVGVMFAAWKGAGVIIAVTTAFGKLVTAVTAAKTAVMAMAGAQELANFGSLLSPIERGAFAMKNLGVAALAAYGPMVALAGGALLIGNGLMHYVQGASQARQITDSLNASIAKAPNSLSSYDSAISQLDQKLKDLNASVGGRDPWHAFLGAFTGDSENFLAENGPLTKLYNGLVEKRTQISGQMAAIAQALSGEKLATPGPQWDNLVSAAGKAGILDFTKSIGDNVAAIRTWQATTLNATPAQQALAAWIAAAGDKAASATTKMQAYQSALMALAGGNIAVQQSQDAVTSSIYALGQNVSTATHDLSGNSLAAIQNRTAIDGVISGILQSVDAMGKQKASQAEVNGYIYSASQSLEAQMVALGWTKAAADTYIQKMLQVPPSVTTKVNTPGLDAANRALADMKFNADQLSGRTISMAVVVSQSGAPLPSGGNYSIYARPHAKGGLIRGPGGSTADKAGLYALSDMETVVPARLTPKYASAFAADGIPGFSKGGAVTPVRVGAGHGGGDLHVHVNVATELLDAGSEVRLAERVITGISKAVHMGTSIPGNLSLTA